MPLQQSNEVEFVLREQIKKVLDETSPKTFSFNWFKEKIVESLIGVMVAGAFIVAGGAVVLVYLGDAKWEAKIKENDAKWENKLKQEKDDTIKRESDLVKMVFEMQQDSEKKRMREPVGSGAPPPVPIIPNIPSLPHIPQLPIQNEILNVQQHPDSAKIQWQEKWNTRRN